MISPRQRLILFITLALFVGCLAIVYVMASLQGGQGHLLLPLDDAYIHFQYAKQLALGHPFQYNLNHPPTSGATSFLYPFVLAFGYLLGFTGLNLALWAMLIGALALFGTLLATWMLLEALDVQHLVKASVLIVVAGCSAWHFFSGMETGLVIFASVATLAALATKHHIWLVLCASLLTLLRPDGGLLATSAVGIALLFQWKTLTRIQRFSLLIPILLIGLQPLVNRLVTGSFVATGNQSKSILATVPHDWSVIVPRVLSNFVRMWTEWMTGYGEQGWYLPPLVGVLALISLFMLLKRPTRPLALVIASWLLLISASVSTLDNAFWHFKRYQMPIMVVLLVISVIFVARFWHYKIIAVVETTLFAVAGVLIGVRFVGAFQTNVGYVYAQPFQMAEWLRNNTSEDAIVAAHDVGLMRYWGERNTLDMVGLTTPDAASYWRNGVGSVAEFLLANRPDYIASYGRGHGYGLGMLENTALMRDPLVSFTVPIDPMSNVALAGETQSIYQPDWANAALQTQLIPQSEAANFYTNNMNDVTTQTLNVADLSREEAFEYQWDGTPEKGYVTEVYEQVTLGTNKIALDGVRRITVTELFTLSQVDTSQEALIITRVHATASGTLDVLVNGQWVATRTLLSAAGNWQEFTTRIPAKLLTSTLRLELIPHLDDGWYSPAMHWWVQGVEQSTALSQSVPLAMFKDAFELSDVTIASNERTLDVSLSWNVLEEKAADTRMFVHLYDNLDEPPVAQWDGYPLGGLPTGNWLLGGLYDTIYIDTTQLAAGEYTVALGFYDVNTGQRLQVSSDTLQVRDNRLLLAEKVVIGG